MNKGLTQVAFGVVGAALLSGSVFAAGPTLLNMPDVIITDRLEAPSEDFDNSLDPTTSANIYRFTTAFPIADHISYTPVDGSDTVSFLFGEHDFDENANGGAGALRTGGDRALTIGGIFGEEDTNIDATDIGSAPGAFQDVLTTTPNFDIVDTIRSGGDGTNPGPDPGGPFLDQAVVQIHVAASAPSTQGAVATRTFNVFTTNDTSLLGLTQGGDQFSVGTTIFTPITRIDEFGGWRHSDSRIEEFVQGMFDPSGQPIDLSVRLDTSLSPNFVPAGTEVTGEETNAIPYMVADGGTTDLTAGTLASPGSSTATSDRPFATQFAFWKNHEPDLPTLSQTPLSIEQSASASDDNIYLVRWNVSATDVPFANRHQTPDVRFQVGSNSTFGLGVWKDEMATGGTNSIRGANHQHRQYIVAEASANNIVLNYSVFDAFEASLIQPPEARTVDYDLTLHNVEVLRFSRNDLAGLSSNPNPVYNQGGGAGVTLAPGQPAPPSGAVNFSTDDWFLDENGDKFLFGGTDNFSGQSRWTLNNNGTSMTANVAATDYSQLAELSTLQFVLNQLPGSGEFTHTDENEVISGVANGQLVVMDVWASSPQGNTANNNLPTMKLGLLGGQFGGTSIVPPGDSPTGQPLASGRAAFREFEASNQEPPDTDLQPIARVSNLETSAKRYTVLLEPQLRVTTNADGPGADPRLDLRLFFTPWAISFDGAAQQQSGTVSIDHVAVYVYDLPEDVADFPVP